MDFTIIYFQDTWDISYDLTARIGFRYEEISMDSVPEKIPFGIIGQVTLLDPHLKMM